MGSELSKRERNRRSRMRETVLRRSATALGFDGDYGAGGDAFIAAQIDVRRESVRRVRSGRDNFSAATANKLRRRLPVAEASKIDVNILTAKVADIKAPLRKKGGKRKKKKVKASVRKKAASSRPSRATITTPSLPCVVVLTADGKQSVTELPADAVVACGPKIEWAKGKRAGTVTLEFARKRTH